MDRSVDLGVRSTATRTQSSMKKHRVAILMHEMDGRQNLGPYAIDLLVPFWRADGHEVVPLYGTRERVDADVVFVHVDLSIVPERYLAFARRYPVAINGLVRDIRKSSFSKNLVGRHDAWEGPVIVKTNYNFGGIPERKRQPSVVHRGLRYFKRLWAPRLAELNEPIRYPIYAHRSVVPLEFFGRTDVVVERFQPERDASGTYSVRNYIFLGRRALSIRLQGPHPIVNGSTAQSVDPVEPHPDILRMREELRMDYGKLDYVVVEDRAILLDVNKTVGCSPKLLELGDLEGSRRYRAEGLYDYFR